MKDQMEMNKKSAVQNAKQASEKENAPASDIYDKVTKDPETNVEIPTETAVEEAKDWVDNENRR